MVKGKVFFCQEPPSGESTTAECGFNYQLLAVVDRVLIKRVRAGTECAIGEEQCGFRQGRGCMDECLL